MFYRIVKNTTYKIKLTYTYYCTQRERGDSVVVECRVMRMNARCVCIPCVTDLMEIAVIVSV